MTMTSRTTNRRAVPKKEDVASLPVNSLDSIHIRWTDDYDILAVHNQIMQHLKSRKDRKAVLEKKLVGSKIAIRNLHAIEEISSLRIQICELEKEITKLGQESRLDYCNAVNPILSEYQTLKTDGPVVMGKKEVKNTVVSNRKTELVEAFFQEAASHYTLDVVRETKNAGLCRLCNGMVVDQGDQYICTDCNSIRTKVEACDDGGDYDDGGKKGSYESGGNFRDFVMQFMMAFPVSIPERILERIKEAAQQYQEFDIKTQLTKTDLVRIMKELHLGAWYKHLNKIYYLLTDKQPADISAYAQNVIKRGALLNNIYSQIKGYDRSNFLHGLHLLWLFLKNEGCEPNMADFVLLKSRDVELANLETLSKGFEILKQTNPEFQWIIHALP